MNPLSEDTAPNVTHVTFAAEARRKLFEGLKIAAEAVGCTLGPRGKTVLIQRRGETPIVTKDGVSVSKAIKLKDPIQRMGAELIREAAARTNEVAGDGTTTSTVLAYALVKEGLKLIESGHDPRLVVQGMEIAVIDVLKSVASSAKLLTTDEEIAQVGTISANGDRRIGELIAKAMQRVGRDGIITVEDAKGTETTLEVAEVMQFDRGYLSPFFVTNGDKMHVAYQDSYVLVTDKKLSSLKDLIPILEKVAQGQKSLLIIAEDVEGEALQGLVLNRVKANLSVVAIKAPGYGKHRDELLSDICALTGGKLVSSSTGVAMDKLTLNDLGRCKKILVDAKSTTLVASGATRQAVEERVASLRSQLEDVTLSADEVTKLKVRIAKLAAGVAIIKVGGATEVEMIERKYRIEDALHATRAAVEEGIVEGGGMALLNATFDLTSPEASLSVRAGFDSVKLACQAPLRRIVENAGKSADVVIADLKRSMCLSDIQYRGYDAANDKHVNMIRAGIIDPAKVTRCAIQNAASVATTFMMLDAVVHEEE